MLLETCMICNSKSNFDMVLMDARRILERINELSNVVRSESHIEREKYMKYEREMMYCSRVPNFMCGQCHMVNTYELDRVEEQLKEAVSKLIFLLTNNTDVAINIRISIKYRALDNLRGFYPKLYRVLEKYTSNLK